MDIKNKKRKSNLIKFNKFVYIFKLFNLCIKKENEWNFKGGYKK